MDDGQKMKAQVGSLTPFSNQYQPQSDEGHAESRSRKTEATIDTSQKPWEAMMESKFGYDKGFFSKG
jgi:hypothetical protein